MNLGVVLPEQRHGLPIAHRHKDPVPRNGFPVARFGVNVAQEDDLNTGVLGLHRPAAPGRALVFDRAREVGVILLLILQEDKSVPQRRAILQLYDWRSSLPISRSELELEVRSGLGLRDLEEASRAPGIVEWYAVCCDWCP